MHVVSGSYQSRPFRFPEQIIEGVFWRTMAVKDGDLNLLSTATHFFESHSLLGNDTGLDVNGTEMPHSSDFIFSKLAFAISGVFVWTALLLTCFQVSSATRKVLVLKQTEKVKCLLSC